MESNTEKTLGDYKLLKYLGRGGFGSVYLAEQRFLKKRFALKVLNPTLSADTQFVERFEKDVALLATLNHPSIVKLFNIGYAEGRYFLVMEPIIDSNENSCNLIRFLETNIGLPEETIIDILQQIAGALDYAHSIKLNGKVLAHRSLKPSNIFISKDEKLNVKISDFGLCNIIGEGKFLLKVYEDLLKEHSSSDGKIQNGLLRNYHFLSPEQKRGIVSEIDEKSDSYAFGVLTYLLLTGHYPEGFFTLPSQIVENGRLDWDWLICKCLQNNKQKRLTILSESVTFNKGDSSLSKIDKGILSWEEIGKKVENAMQLSFALLTAEKTVEATLEKKSCTFSHVPLLKPSELARPDYDPDPGAIFHKAAHVSLYQPQVIETKNLSPILTEMIVVPAGSYFRGSDDHTRDEEPRHQINILSFALDIHPVTNEQFARFLEVMGGEKDANNNDLIRLRDSRIKRNAGKVSIEAGYSKHPVVGVTWYGAYSYAKWVGKRLPTEGEWEVAAVGKSDKTIYPTGKDIDHTQANFFSSDTTAVMSYPPNSIGLYDMVGNVYEWCEDWYAYNYYETSIQEPNNPKGPPQGVYRVLRGGCWKSLKEDLRCSHRHRNNPGAVNRTYGFRCAADVS